MGYVFYKLNEIKSFLIKFHGFTRPELKEFNDKTIISIFMKHRRKMLQYLSAYDPLEYTFSEISTLTYPELVTLYHLVKSKVRENTTKNDIENSPELETEQPEVGMYTIEEVIAMYPDLAEEEEEVIKNFCEKAGFVLYDDSFANAKPKI